MFCFVNNREKFPAKLKMPNGVLKLQIFTPIYILFFVVFERISLAHFQFSNPYCLSDSVTNNIV